MKSASWTGEETERLRQMAAKGMCFREAAMELGRSYEAVRLRAHRKQISFRRDYTRRDYTRNTGATDDELLRERWLRLLPGMKEALRRDLENNI